MGEDMETVREQLASVRAAIAAIEGGAQEYQIANRRLQHADLATLYARETRLKTELASLTDGGIYFAATGRL